jgi:hypothetical protein
MPRKRKIRTFDTATLNEIFARYGMDGVEEMIMMASIIVDPQTGEKVPRLVRDMGAKEGWSLVFRIWQEVAQYQHPKLRQLETNNKTDYNITVVLKEFSVKAGQLVDNAKRQETLKMQVVDPPAIAQDTKPATDEDNDSP